MASTFLDDLRDIEAEVAQQPQQDAQPGSLGRVARDVAVGVTEAPFQAARGFAEGLNQTGRFLRSAADGLGGPSRAEVEANTQSQVGRYLARPLDAVTDATSALVGALPEAGTVTGGLVSSVGQFVAGNLLAGRYLRFFGADKIGGAVGQAIARDVIAGGTAFDPYEDRLSNILRDHAELRDPITAFLAADPSDSEAEARFKSALENGGLGALGEGAFHAFRAWRASRRGDAAGAARAAEDAERALPEGEVQRMVSESLTLRSSQEDWLEVSRTDTTTTTNRTTTTEGTRTTTTGPMADEVGAPRPTATFDQAAGGTAMPARIELTADEAGAIAREYAASRSLTAGLTRETLGYIYRNIDRMQSGDDGVALVTALERAFADNYDAARGVRQSQSELAANAEKWATAAADIAADSRQQRDMLVQAMTADLQDARRIGARAMAYSALTTALQKRSAEYAESIILARQGRPFGAFGGDKEKLYAAFLRDTNFLANVDPLTMGLRSQFGRNLSMLNGVVRGEGEGMAMSAAARMEGRPATSKTVTEDFTRTTETTTTRHTITDKVKGGEENIVELAYRIRYARDAGQARKIATQHFRGSSAWKAAGEYWTNALLSSPKTHVVGLLASGFRSSVQFPAERLMAGVVHLAAGNGAGAWRNVREAAYQYQGMMQALGDAWSLAGRSMREGDSLLDPSVTQVELGRKAITAGTFGQSDQGVPGFLINSLGSLTRTPSNLLIGQDEFFKQLYYRGRVFAMARREASDMGLDAQQAALHIENRLKAATDVNGRATSEEALAEARRLTFTDEFGEGWLSGLGSGVQSLKARAPFMHVLVPFVRVPTNILREVVNTNPLTAAFQREVRDEIAKGGDAAAMMLSRIGTGTAVMLTAVNWALEGRITGSGPSNPQARRGMGDMEFQPNSIRIVDDEGNIRFVSYNRADPFGVVLSVAATMADIAREMQGETRENKLDDLAMMVTAGAVKALASKTYATGLMQFAQAISDGDARLEVVMRSLAATLIPAITRDLSNATYDNPYFREATSMAEAMRARTPGFGDVDVRYTALGEPAVMPLGAGVVLPQAVLNVISPASMRTVRADDPVTRELLRLQLVHNTGFTPPSHNPGNVGIDLRDFRHPEGGTAHGRLQMLVGEVEVGGKRIREAMADLFASDRYQRATDGTLDIDGSKMMYVQALFQGFNEKALQALRQEWPEVREAMDARRRLRIDVIRNGGQSVAPRTSPTLADMLRDPP